MTVQRFGDGSGFKFTLETAGSWRAIANGERELYLRSQYQALKEEGDVVKGVARQSVRKGKFRGAARMATSWRGAIFPANRNVLAARPAYVLGTNAAMPLDHLESGITINAKGGALMIPIGEAARFKQPNFVEQSGRLARTIAAMKAKYGELSWRKMRDGTLALGAWSPNRAGVNKFKALFILRRSVTIPKKLDTKNEIAAAARGIEQRVADRTMQLFAAGHDAVVQRAMRSAGR